MGCDCWPRCFSPPNEKDQTGTRSLTVETLICVSGLKRCPLVPRPCVTTCDVIVASTQAVFADTHARVGILPGWGLGVRLPRLIGSVRAKSVSLTGNPIPADQAERWGLVSSVVEPDELMPTCRALAEDMISCDPKILKGYKRLIDECIAMPFDEALAHENAVATASAREISADTIAQRRKGIQARNRDRSSD